MYKIFAKMISGNLVRGWAVAAVLSMTAQAGEPLRWIPEWEPNGMLLLVWPEYVSGQKKLTPVYLDLIRQLPADSKVALVGTRPPSTRSLEALNRDVRYLALTRLHDVWIRDWAALPARQANGETVAVKFIYRPRYLSGRDASAAYADDMAGRQLARMLFDRVEEVPLILDGGSITHNGEGRAIVSNRIITDNESVSIPALRETFKTLLGVDHLLFVPVPSGEVTGHLNGLIRFVSADTLAIAQYPETDSEGRAFTDELEQQVRKEWGRSLRIVRVPCATPEARRTEGVGSVLGNPMGFLMIGSRIFVPTFGLPEDEAAVQALTRALPDREVIVLSIEEIQDLAQKGGHLQAITAMSWGR